MLSIWQALGSESSIPKQSVLRAARMQHPEYLSLFLALDNKRAEVQQRKREAEKNSHADR